MNRFKYPNLWLIAGMIVASAALPFALKYAHQRDAISQDEHRAHGMDRGRSFVAAGACAGVLKGVDELARKRVVGSSFDVAVHLQNESNAPCSTQVALYASAFEINPSTPRDVTLAHEVKRVYWNLTPKYAGDQVLLISTGNEQREIGFIVKDAKLVPEWASLAAALLAFVFGGTLTVPWWIDRRDKAREKKKQSEQEEAAKKSLIILPP